MAKNILYFVFFFFIFSCSTKKQYESNPVLAQKLYEEGQHLLSDRIKIQGTDSIKARELNKKVLKKFEAAYKADTTNLLVLLFASECTMYERDYGKCLFWTLKYVQQDTSKSDALRFYERIGECYTKLGEAEKGKPYYEKEEALKRKSSNTQ